MRSSLCALAACSLPRGPQATRSQMPGIQMPMSLTNEAPARRQGGVSCVRADADPYTPPLYSLPLHSTAVSSASPGHLREYCDIQRESLGEHRPGGRTFKYKLTLLTGEPETVPRAVFFHAYTGALPDDLRQLIWVSLYSNAARRRRIKAGPALATRTDEVRVVLYRESSWCAAAARGIGGIEV